MGMKSNVVFVGPSLDPDSVSQNLDCTVLGPIRRGDIDALLAARTKANSIGIVDGQFFQSMSISPKEVLRAIDSDVRVFGAASMGALRAAELALYGMVGVGLIFDLFASGDLDADDEVAMTFDPATFSIHVPGLNPPPFRRSAFSGSLREWRSGRVPNKRARSLRHQVPRCLDHKVSV